MKIEGKKTYISPEIMVVNVESDLCILTGSDPEAGAGSLDSIFGDSETLD